MNGSTFLPIVAAGLALIVVALVVAAVVGSVRHRRGRVFSDEIEEAAGMEPNPLEVQSQRPRPRRSRRRAAA